MTPLLWGAVQVKLSGRQEREGATLGHLVNWMINHGKQAGRQVVVDGFLSVKSIRTSQSI